MTVTGKPIICEYSAAHKAQSIPAVTEIDCRPAGIVPACQKCADFYREVTQ